LLTLALSTIYEFRLEGLSLQWVNRMIKNLIQDPAQVKAMVSGVSTTVLGITVNAQQLTLWSSILADLGVFAAACVTVVLGVQSFRNRKKKDD